MSLARYRPWLPGGPQRRVLFTDFFMKLIKNKRPAPPNVVTFQCHVNMTKFDIKNYLEQIYKVPVAKVNTAIIDVPHLRDHKLRRWKPEQDYKLAYITLGEGQTFEFPDVFEKDKEELAEMEQSIEDLKNSQRQTDTDLSKRGGIPQWFGAKDF